MNGTNGSDIFTLTGFRFSSRQLRRGFNRRMASALKKTGQSLSSETLEPRSMMSVAPPAISVDDVTITEGDTGTRNAAIMLRLSHAASTPVSLRFATGNGTATAGSDYLAKTGIVTFPAGTTTRQVLVGIRGDRAYEPNETFTFNLSAARGATIADPSGVVTIANNDQAPTLAPAPTASPAVALAAPALVAARWPRQLPHPLRLRSRATGAVASTAK